jgi:recombination protein RecA
MAILPLPNLRLPKSLPQPAPWALALAAGRLVEVAGAEDSAALTLTSSLILDAQKGGEQAAWILLTESPFFAPDMLESGIDLDALVVVRVPSVVAGARAADKLIRSGSFGIVVLDAGLEPRIPTPLLARLASLAQRNHTALVFLTQHGGATVSAGTTPTGAKLTGVKRDGATPTGASPPSVTLSDPTSASTSSLGSLISLRVRARRQRIAADRFRCWLEVLKDKRRGPTWGHEEVCRGAPGMR